MVIGHSGKGHATSPIAGKVNVWSLTKVKLSDTWKSVASSKGSPKDVKTGKGSQNAGLKVPTKSYVGDASDWLDCSDKFVMSPPNARREDYFILYIQACSYRGSSDILSDKGLKKRLGKLEYVHKSCVLNEDMFIFVRYAFQIPTDIKIRIPEEGEKI